VEPASRISISDDVHIESIWPAVSSAEAVSADDPNEHNCVYMINYRGTKIMVTGDLLEKDELEMIEHYRKNGREDVLKCDVLKVAHHGSKSSSSEAFLDAASPSIAVISAGRNNIYGHPHAQTLGRLEERGIAVYRTDLNGAVGIDIRRNKVKVDVMHPSPGS
jgi:competence protein ComEC